MGTWALDLFGNDKAQDFLARLPKQSAFSLPQIRKCLEEFHARIALAVDGEIREVIAPEVLDSLLEYWKSGSLQWLQDQGIFETDPESGQARIARNYIVTPIHEYFDEVLAACAILAAGLQSDRKQSPEKECARITIYAGNYNERSTTMRVSIAPSLKSRARTLVPMAVDACKLALNDERFRKTFDNADYGTWERAVRDVLCVLEDSVGA